MIDIYWWELAEVQEQSRSHGRCHHASELMRKANKQRSDTAQHTASCHSSSQTHGANNQPNGIDHTRHSTGSNQVIQFG